MLFLATIFFNIREGGDILRRNVIFDMDGVLIDSQPLHFETDLKVLREAGADPKRKDVERLAGTPNKERWPEYIRKFRLAAQAGELIALYHEIFTEMFLKGNFEPSRGVSQLIGLLRSEKIKTAVASSTNFSLVSLILDRIGLKDFDAIITGEMVARGKPAPDIFLAAALALNASPENCAVIEDSASGVASAKDAGMFCVAYRNPTSGKQNLLPADMIIDSFSEINASLNWLQSPGAPLRGF